VIRRREFIAGLGAAAWSSLAHAQQVERVRRIGVLMGFDENDPQPQGWFSGFAQGLAELGWTDGRTMRMDVRWTAGNFDRQRVFAKELVDLQPDVIFAASTPVSAALHRETRTIPIVFVQVTDPVGEGFIASEPRPGGNMTGFIPWEPSMGGKFLQLLTEIAPSIKRAAIMFNPDTAPFVRPNFQPSFEAAARLLKVAPIVAPVRSDAEIETVITSLGREPRGGLILMPESFMVLRRPLIIPLISGNNVPTVCGDPGSARYGGLVYYGTISGDEYRRAALYVDRILRGAKPADLPVQRPTKLEMIVNAKAAKALGLTVPQSILLRADEVIE
jgi:putative tryptophan/tyrosine transport system substrate-binding protein